RTASEATHGGIRTLLPRGSNAPRSREGHSSRSTNSNSRGCQQDSILAETRRPASLLYSCSVDSRAVFPVDQIPFRVPQPRHSLCPAHILCEHFRLPTNHLAIPNRRPYARRKKPLDIVVR